MLASKREEEERDWKESSREEAREAQPEEATKAKTPKRQNPVCTTCSMSPDVDLFSASCCSNGFLEKVAIHARAPRDTEAPPPRLPRLHGHFHSTFQLLLKGRDCPSDLMVPRPHLTIPSPIHCSHATQDEMMQSRPLSPAAHHHITLFSLILQLPPPPPSPLHLLHPLFPPMTTS